MTTPAFIVGLLLLFLNDFFFKEFYHNWLTGKLSDFSGVFIFIIFLGAVFFKRPILAYFLGTIWFIFWKSPFSQPLIDWVNSHSFLHLVRVVDWTDLFALVVVPFAYRFQFGVSKHRYLRLPVVVPLLLACFLFVATSDDEFDPAIFLEESYELEMSEDAFFTRLAMIDSVRAPAQPVSSAFEFSYYSPNCEIYIEALAGVDSISDTTSLLSLVQVYADCYKEEDPAKVEGSIQALLEEFETEVLEML